MPPMDGAFRPNDLLDSAPPIIETPAPDCLAVTSQGIVVSSQCALLSVDRPGDAPLAAFDAEISALAGLPDGGAAVGLIDGRIVFVGGEQGGKTIAASPDSDVHHRAGAGPRRNAARRQRLGVERPGRLEARPDGEERLRVGVADRTDGPRRASNWREIWLTPTAFSRMAIRSSSRRAGAAR